jgi:hypothetical protein
MLKTDSIKAHILFAQGILTATRRNHGPRGCHQEEKGATPGIDLRLGALVQREEREY